MNNMKIRDLLFYLSSFFLFFVFLIFFENFAFAGPYSVPSNLVPNDQQYYSISTPSMDLIFTKEHIPYLSSFQKAQEALLKNYESSYAWKMDEKPSVVLTSTYNQVPNAFATIAPYPLMTFYSGGSPMNDYFTTRSWLIPTLVHENAHLYQLNSKRGLGQFVHTIFGNHAIFLFPIFPLPIFVSPNILTPTWLLEGNAVLNESRFGLGGRLYNGEERALFLTLLKARLLNEKRLTNEHIDFPFTREKYIVGSYFMLYLSERFGIDKVNQFFQEQADHYFFPIILNNTFAVHFQLSYSQAIEDFLKHYQTQADKLASATTAHSENIKLGQSVFSLPFSVSEDGKKIFFLSAGDGRSVPKLHIIDRESGVQSIQKIDLKAGKVFQDQDRFVSSAVGKVDRQKNIYGLWTEAGRLVTGTEGLDINDKRAGHTLMIDVNKSINTIFMTKDGKHLGRVSSKGILDSKGRAYYFINTPEKNSLMRDGEELISFKAHFAKLCFVDESKQQIIFISNTELGSSAYAFDEQSSSLINLTPNIDNISQMIPVGSSSYLIEEITEQGYQQSIMDVKKANLIAKNEVPVAYSYKIFDADIKGETAKTLQSAESIGSVETESAIPQSAQEYSDLKQLRYSRWGIQGEMKSYTNKNYYHTSLFTSFEDPLGHNVLDLLASLSSHPSYDRYAEISYANKKHLLSYGIELSFRNIERDNYKHHLQESLFLSYPFWQQRYDEISAYTSLTRTEKIKDPYSAYGKLILSHKRAYALSFIPEQLLSLTPETDVSYEGSKQSLLAQGVQDLGGEHFIMAEALSVKSTTGVLDWGSPIHKKSTPFLFPTIHKHYKDYKEYSGKRATLGLAKTLNYGAYGEAFPISLRRFAPEIFSSYVKIQNSKNIIRNDFEYGLGVRWELLFVHKLPLTFATDYLINAKDKSRFLTFNFSIAADV